MIDNENEDDLSTPNDRTEQVENNVDTDDITYLRNKYLNAKHKGGEFTVTDKMQLICNILLLCAVIIPTLCTAIWFASPTIKLGGDTQKSGAQNIFSFIFIGEDSMLERIKAAMQSLSNFNGGTMDAITSFPHLFRYIVLGISGIYVLITSIYHVIAAGIFFSKSSTKLKSVAASSITSKFMAYINFAFLGSMSGGSGSNAYYLGYTCGTGMTVGLALAFCCITATTVITFIRKYKTADKGEKIQFIRSTVSCVGYTIIAIMLAQINLYGVFMYILSSTAQAMAYTIQYTFEIKVVLFPLLNIIIICACYYLWRKSNTGFNGAVVYLTTFDTNELTKIAKPNKMKKFRSRLSLKFIGATVMSTLALTAAFLLNIPSIGLGWDFDFYTYLIVIATISATGIVLHEILLKPLPTPPAQNNENTTDVATNVAA